MSVAEGKRAGGIAYREALPGDGESSAAGISGPALCLHGFPETSYMWNEVLDALATSGRRAIAPDFPGFGDSPPDLPGTWERKVEAVERFRQDIGLERVALVVHDWGSLIGLWWACEHPDAVSALVISSGGFFPDGKWNGMAKVLKTEGQGEEMLANLDRETLGGVLATTSDGFTDAAIDHYAKALTTEEGRQGALDQYRSGEFSKLQRFDGRVAGLGVPTLLLWGEDDEFSPVAGAHRFKKEIPHAELVAIEGAGHFVYADEPERCGREIVSFLDSA